MFACYRRLVCSRQPALSSSSSSLLSRAVLDRFFSSLPCCSSVCGRKGEVSSHRTFTFRLGLSYRQLSFSSSSSTSPSVPSDSNQHHDVKKEEKEEEEEELPTGVVLGEENVETEGVTFTDVPGVKTQGDKYTMVYTCSVCETRAAKIISKQAYHHGVVIIRCPQCKNLHLIADHLGQFEEKGWNVEDFLAKQGDKVNRVAHDNVLELTMKDVIGGKKD